MDNKVRYVENAHIVQVAGVIVALTILMFSTYIRKRVTAYAIEWLNEFFERMGQRLLPSKI